MMRCSCFSFLRNRRTISPAEQQYTKPGAGVPRREISLKLKARDAGDSQTTRHAVRVPGEPDFHDGERHEWRGAELVHSADYALRDVAQPAGGAPDDPGH